MAEQRDSKIAHQKKVFEDAILCNLGLFCLSFYNLEIEFILLQAPESGNYTFYVSCDDLCELWMHDVTEEGIESFDKKSERTVSKQPIITVERWTDHHQWDK